MAKLNILVAEDDEIYQETLGQALKGHNVAFAADAPAAKQKLAAGKHDICFIDLKLGDKDPYSGLQLIAEAKDKGVYSVVLTSHDSQDVVDQASNLGCDDFYRKEDGLASVNSVLARFNNRRHNFEKDKLFSERFITDDPETRADVWKALSHASSSLPILILGPSGTGKTNLARIFHDRSGRSGEFVSINCSAHTEELLEAELFGYRKGAFTGAAENRKGKLLQADKGTLFLDEVGSMSLAMQSKLLTAIEEHSFYPLGADKPQTSEFSIISATLEDMQSLLTKGKMRFDFFQRIHGLPITLKPLARRKCDIVPLMSHFTREGSRRLSFEPAAKDLLLAHHWPGNTREIKRLAELLVSGNEVRVTAEQVRGLLAQLSLEIGAQEFVTEEQYNFAVQHGLYALLDRMTDMVLRRNMTESRGNKSQVLRNMRIPNNLLYRSLDRDSQDQDKALPKTSVNGGAKKK